MTINGHRGKRRGKARCLKPQQGIEPIGRCGGGGATRGYNKEPKNLMSVTCGKSKVRDARAAW